MKRLWFKFIAMFKRKQSKPTAQVDTAAPTGKHAAVNTIILIPGHERGGGMTIYNDTAENEFCTRLTHRIKMSYAGDPRVILLKREHSSYSRYLSQIRGDINDLSLDHSKTLAIELHLNDASPSARGAEALVCNSRTLDIAAPFVQDFCKKFSIKLRGKFKKQKGVRLRDSGDGSGFLKTMDGLGIRSFIWEPVFAGDRTEESSQFFDDMDIGLYKMNTFFVDMMDKIFNNKL